MESREVKAIQADKSKNNEWGNFFSLEMLVSPKLKYMLRRCLPFRNVNEDQ